MVKAYVTLKSLYLLKENFSYFNIKCIAFSQLERVENMVV